MASPYKFILSGSSPEFNNVTVDNNVAASTFTGDLSGTSSWAESSSFAVSASYAPAGQQSPTSSYALTASFVDSVFSEGGTFADPINGISFSSSFCVFRAPYSCRVQSLYGKRFDGSDCFINARKSGSGGYLLHTGSNVTLTSDNIWFLANSVANTDYSAGDSLEVIISGSGNSQIAVQLGFIRI